MNTAVLILNYNGGADTVTCLRSLLPGLGPQDYVFVTDNSSTDDSVAQIKRYFETLPQAVTVVPEAELTHAFDPMQHFYLLRNTANFGFGGGHNKVFRQLPLLQIPFSYSWLLNNDALATAGSLSSLKETLEKNNNVGMAGSLILNYPDTGTVQCAGVKYYKWLGVSKLIYKNLPYAQLNRQAAVKFDYLNGASFMLRTKALEDCGYFDERFFLYSEEQDLELRLQKKGYGLYLDLNSVVYHKLSGASSSSRHLFYYQYNRSAVLLSKKHFSGLTTACTVLSLCAITFLRTFPSLKNLKWGLKGIASGLKK